MDSYDLFGEDGSGMLEGLTDLGGTDNFTDGSTPTVTAGSRDPPERSYRQAYSQGSVSTDNSLQKLASFSGGGGGVPGGPPPTTPGNAGAPTDYSDYGAYPPRPRLPHPSHAPHHPPHHTHPSHGYPGFHTGPEPMYSMPDHPGIADISVWPPASGNVRAYPPTPQGYRHPYDQQKLHQYPQQGSTLGLQGIPQSGGYIQRQPHYPPSQQLYPQQQAYPNYAQLHPQNVSRIGQHPTYHQQMDINPHQYGHPHSQQNHPSVPAPHQTHQTLSSHQANIAPQQGIPGHPSVHPSVHLHHGTGASLHHPSRPVPPPSSSVTSTPTAPPQSSYAQPPLHPVSMSYPPHQLQRSLDVNIGIANQYSTPKQTGIDGGSPQYRTTFPQLSPQMSPRAQMSPKQAPPQMSPRSAMSPAKGPNASPHSSRPPAPSPVPSGTATSNSASAPFNQQNTLQAIEQMVIPGSTEYPYQCNPASPIVGRVRSSPQQWNQNQIATTINGANEKMIATEPAERLSNAQEPNTVNTDSSQLTNVNITLEHSRTSEILHQNNENTKSTDILIPSIEDKTVNTSALPTVHKLESLSSNEQEKYSEKCSYYNPTQIPTDNVKKDLDGDTNTDNKHEISGQDKDHTGGQISSVPICENTAELTKNTVGLSTTISNKDHIDILDQKNTISSMTTVSGSSTFNIHGVPNPHMSSVNNQLNTISNVNVVGGTTPYDTVPNVTNRSNSLSMNPMQQNVVQNLTSNIAQGIPASIPSNLQVNVSPNIQANLVQTPNLQTSIQNIPPSISNQINSNISSTVQSNISAVSVQSNISPSANSAHQANMTNNLQSIVPPSNVQPNLPTNVSCIPPNIPNLQGSLAANVSGMPSILSSLHTNMATNLPNISPNMPQTMQSVQPNIAMNIQNVQSNMTTNIPNVSSNMGPTLHPNMSHIILAPGLMPNHNMTAIYHGPISHHQERAALQQQIQEIFCMPPSPENQEKVRHLQERLSMLQQHESNDKCNGGPNCILQNPIYGSTMVESPQVSSTTGRGRSKGPPRPRKPRVKKEKSSLSVCPQSIEQLPLSEDCVTAGTGLQNSKTDLESIGDFSSLDNTSIGELNKDGKPKKPRAARKPRKPRAPKEPKLPKPVKEKVDKPARKKREPKNPNAPRRKRTSKKDTGEIHADTTTNLECTSQIADNISVIESMPLKTGTVTNSCIDQTNTNNTNVTDFDDIPVSKIAIKDLLEEAEAKREQVDKEDDTDSICNSPTKRKPGKKKSSITACNKKPIGRKSISGKKKKRGGIVPESDGEPDDMMSTPPPSPPVEGDCDSSKRRSGRHTQRKKYTDDVMLRLSDDEFPVITASKIETEVKSNDVVKTETKDDLDDKTDGIPKPNYMYVNTTDEDTMIVQHVLTCRMGKREVKPESLPVVDNVRLQNENTNISTIVKEEVDVSCTEELKDLDETNEIKSGVTAPVRSPVSQVNQPLDDIIKTANSKEICTESVLTEESDGNVISNDIKSKAPIIVDVEEYFVKYRNFSYLHCEWKTEEELYKGDKRIYSKIKRYKQKQSQQVNIYELFDDEPFNPDYVEVERVLDVSENVDPGSESAVKHFLVKWKSLQYEDSTWELEEDVDIDKIRQFEQFSAIPPKETWKYKRRPPADQWVQLKESPLYKAGNTLRPYQLEGLNWLLFSWYNNRNCILADEMGLGKTIQSLTFVNSVWEYGIRGPFLIIAPLSTIPNWQREFEAWTDMNVIVYHGSQQSKSMIQEYEFYFKSDKVTPIKEITKFNVLITTFEIIVTDFQDLKSFNWRICVIDEAHRLKNRNCKLLEGLRQLHLEHRVLLSGTPLQNNVNELFSLLNFLEPSQFASSDAFLTEFGQLKSESEVIKLQALLKPMMLRRLKEDVEKTLAPKEETIIEVELTNIQKKYYRAILERNFSFLCKGTASASNIPNLMNIMMELRKCCIHPYLLNGAEEQIQFDYKSAYGEDSEAYYKALIQSSGKMVLVDKLLPKLKSGGHRVLIFSQMVRCLDILEDYLMYRKYPFERIDGRIRGNFRQEAIDRFSKPDSDRFVFLLCTKAGGLGINLTAADTVIIYDSDWNPQNDLQAQARCHRIGQQKMVKIYRLLCRNTYEREMFDKASLKLGLDKAVLQTMNTSQGKEAGTRQLSKKEIEDLLKKGAYGAVMDEDNAGDKFCEEDIEMILARRTQVIQMEAEKGSTFSKASFSAADQRSDIDIRDPDFWNKWAKKAEVDTTEKKEDEDLIVTEPRRRTLIKRYGHDDGTVEMSDIEVTPDSDEEGEGIGLRSKRKKDKFGRRSRKYVSDEYLPHHDGVSIHDDVIYGSWSRSECFKIERGLLTFGWGRWEEILDKNQFRKGWMASAVEDCARIIVLYCLRHYKGDEKIRNFIWDLIEPCENGEVTISRNHSGLHNPVPRGRNAKKKNKSKDLPKFNALQKWEDSNHWSSADKYDCEAYLESSYKKHLFRHANKVLLRVRMMYYIKHEVIGDYTQQIDSGVHASTLGMRVPRAVEGTPPRTWWDADCDVSLLMGTYLHGYENYLAMRTDPQLCFIDKLGPPDDAECTNIKSEEISIRCGTGGDEDGTDDVSSGAGALSPATSSRLDDDSTQSSIGGHPWPSMQDLNTRLRRLITAYQRNYKKEELKMQQKAKLERREKMELLAREEASQWRWTRADEEAFRRTVASYGVEFDPMTKSLRWGRFRALARLDTKSDDALTDYLKAFMAMCKRQCGLSVGEAELPTRPDLRAEPIGEERAIATLERIDLLRVLREEVAPHPALDNRLAVCEHSSEAPPWWQSAKHDKLLVLGVCKHGLGDTYHKLFCDPKLPFADCARKWTDSRKVRAKTDTRQSSDDEDDSNIMETNTKSDTNVCDTDQLGEDRDALSELETLAKLGRTDGSPPPNHWFSERALETRLHHIAHAVQNGEWPGEARQQRAMESINSVQNDGQDDKRRPKKHIAIDVETERAKLHALLSSPHPAMAHGTPRERLAGPRVQMEIGDISVTTSSKTSGWERDDASSDSGSRRSTPAPSLVPPPAHQRPAPSPALSSASAASNAAPVDLSAPLDLSEVQDFSVGHKTPVSEPATFSPTSLTPPVKGKLDDTLSKLLKRKNAPEPEMLTGKEKKRKKLDDIVLGLSAAKSRNTAGVVSTDSSRSKNTPVLPNVTVLPAVAPSSSPAPQSQKPFSVTVTSVPSPHSTPKELSSFLQQSLEQTSHLKSQKASSTPMKPYSHEAKVNKWLAEQASVESRRRALAPRIAPDEHVPVVNRLTGKRLVGHKAPQLKHLVQWIAENPIYDIDPKWTDGVKESVKLSQDVRAQRHSPMQSSVSTGERKKGRPPSLDTTSTSGVSSGSNYGSLSQNLAGLNPALLASLGAFDPKTLAATLSNLAGFDPKTLNSFDPKLLASLSSFDPKNNPLLMSFNSMPNMLGNLTNSNIFANLAGLSLPGFSGVDMSNLGVTSGADASNASKSKMRKTGDGGSSASKSSTNMSSSASQFPFVFPNPNLLYPQLSLSGLNPFGMQTGLSSAYDALGLLNGNLAVTSTTTTAHNTTHNSARSTPKVTTTKSSSVTSATTSTNTRHQKNSVDRQHVAQLQQLLLPPDTYLLESLAKQSASYDAAFKTDKKLRDFDKRDLAAADLSKGEKRKSAFETSRTQLPPEFVAVQERLLKGDKKDVDISKMLLEQMASGALSASLVSSVHVKKQENEGKDAFDKLSKTSAEFIARSLGSEESLSNISVNHKRMHEEISNEPENLVMHTEPNFSKKTKENIEGETSSKINVTVESHATPPNTGEMDLEDLIAPSTVIRSGHKPSSDQDTRQTGLNLTTQITSQHASTHIEKDDESSVKNTNSVQQEEITLYKSTKTVENDEVEEKLNSICRSRDDENETSDSANLTEEVSEVSDCGRKIGRKKPKKPDENIVATVGGIRRELRSSAGRQAAAAAARHAAAANANIH